MEPLLLRPEEAAEALRLSRARVYEMIAAAELPSVKVGKYTRVPLDALREWVAARSEPKGSGTR
jgi:excisionase family DNA binding protein